jgi:hypothetical protein
MKPRFKGVYRHGMRTPLVRYYRNKKKYTSFFVPADVWAEAFTRDGGRLDGTIGCIERVRFIEG